MMKGAMWSPFPFTVSVIVMVSLFVVDGVGRIVLGFKVTTRWFPPIPITNPVSSIF